MLDTETKTKIDSARDILVGKVPDPKSQVEQITIALIYKFMDDMDRQSEELGGKATFFTGEFKKYRWSQLLDKRMGGHERLLLYAEGIEKMNVNAAIPQLFRDIFKGVFLPYRDPETLNWFLKEIDGFSYDHSERLGDAFEYLLSVLGTQGNAGQFRTPRHIIDFIAAVVDPQKNETVLDPACGTAGFLISAYKHIVQANKDLTPDERARLMTNFAGYDIAPDMVRLSRVNMYLHGFPNPTIHEYDALTSEERWDDRFDVIMANPPFMSPKGGIRPHNRFAIQAKRSEVLFVDYIAEHLNPGGRAGIIVPEGIIFQAQNAYKNLRRMLVENYLWAVVSLPAGVFNPYSGVKTSILFLDKNLAKRTDDILFVKVANDGFDLGAQRRAVQGGELAEALKILHRWKTAQSMEGHAPSWPGTGENATERVPPMVIAVGRERLLESPDCNLSGERYRETQQAVSQHPIVRLGDYIHTVKVPRKLQKSEFGAHGTYPIIDQSQNTIAGWTDDVDAVVHIDNPVVIFGDHTCAVKYMDRPFVQGADGIKILKPTDPLLPRFLFYWLRTFPVSSDGYKRHFSKLVEASIPLPPLGEQERIVAELDGYRKVIEGARQVVENYKPTIQIDPAWPSSNLGDLAQNLDGKRVPIEKGKRKHGPYPYYGASGIVDHVDSYIFDGEHLLLSEDGANLLRRTTPIAFSVCGKIWVNNHAHILAFADPITRQFVEHYINSIDISSFVTGAAQPKLSQANMNRIPVPLPPVEVQRKLVASIQSEQAAISANQELIGAFERKIQTKLAVVWGEKAD